MDSCTIRLLWLSQWAKDTVRLMRAWHYGNAPVTVCEHVKLRDHSVTGSLPIALSAKLTKVFNCN